MVGYDQALGYSSRPAHHLMYKIGAQGRGHVLGAQTAWRRASGRSHYYAGEHRQNSCPLQICGANMASRLPMTSANPFRAQVAGNSFLSSTTGESGTSHNSSPPGQGFQSSQV